VIEEPNWGLVQRVIWTRAKLELLESDRAMVQLVLGDLGSYPEQQAAD
jgi:hypothetical protein